MKHSLDDIKEASQPLIDEMVRLFRLASPPTTTGRIEAIKGRKYVRIMRGFDKSVLFKDCFLVEGFIDNEGNILFGAHDRPYKYASAIRGNIFNDDRGFGALSNSGLLRYL